MKRKMGSKSQAKAFSTPIHPWLKKKKKNNKKEQQKKTNKLHIIYLISKWLVMNKIVS